jgi:hypothetical protein
LYDAHGFIENGAKRAQPTGTKKKPLTRDELNQRLMAAGLITSLPHPALDIDDKRCA